MSARRIHKRNPKLLEWHATADRIEEIRKILGISRKDLINGLVEKHGYRSLSEWQFKHFLNGTRCPPDFNSLIAACAKLFSRRDQLNELPEQERERQYLARITGRLESSASDHASGNEFVVHKTRIGFWRDNIETIIRECDTLVIVDSFLGYKQTFWSALEDRATGALPFHFTLLILRRGDPFLKLNLNLVGAPDEITEVDLAASID
jgi:hypothetical protein